MVLTTYTHIDSLCRISTKQARGVKAFATEAAAAAAAATRPRWVARLACCSIGFSTGYLDRSAIRALRRTRRHCTVVTFLFNLITALASDLFKIIHD